MTNVYGYNRKTLEEDEAILRAVKRHHEEVEKKGYLVVMTSLVGSQNYDLDHPKSDIDTYSLIFPPLSDLASAQEPISGMFELDNGQCVYKDIRIALKLLYKTSPNSVEYFVSKYKIYNPIFESILHEYLDDNSKAFAMIHCNYNHMLYAMAGMARQLTTRNMPIGKRYAHSLRLDNMYYHFMNSLNAAAVLEMRPGGDRDLAFFAKTDKTGERDLEYEECCAAIAERLDELRLYFKLTEEQRNTEQYGLSLIDSFRWKLFKKYLEEVNK